MRSGHMSKEETWDTIGLNMPQVICHSSQWDCCWCHKRLETQYGSLTTASASAVLQNLDYRLLVSVNIIFTIPDIKHTSSPRLFICRWIFSRLKCYWVVVGTWLDCGRCLVVGGENSPLGSHRLPRAGEGNRKPQIENIIFQKNGELPTGNRFRNQIYCPKEMYLVSFSKCTYLIHMITCYMYLIWRIEEKKKSRKKDFVVLA